MRKVDSAHAAKRQSVTTVGSGDEEIKIYTLHRKDGSPDCEQDKAGGN